MADVLRSCTKTGCRWPAAASLSYRYATRQVWLLDLSPATDPSLYDLCPHHADHLVVPKGWERVDDRTPQEVMVEPSAFDRAEAARLRQPTTISARGRELVSAGPPGPRNRYAQLVEQLPRLAAEAHASEDARFGPDGATDGHGAGPTGHADDRDAAADHGAGEERGETTPADTADEQADLPTRTAATPPAAAPGPVPPEPPAAAPSATAAAPGNPAASSDRPAPRPVVPSRDLAPMPAGEPLWQDAAPGSSTPPPPQHELRGDPLPGQLSIPVDDLIESSGGVVVAFDLAGRTAGGRRRTPRT